MSLDFESDALIPPIPLVQNMELSPECKKKIAIKLKLTI